MEFDIILFLALNAGGVFMTSDDMELDEKIEEEEEEETGEDEETEASQMSLFDHLEELRKRLIIIAAVIFVATVISFVYIEEILDIITRPAEDLQLIYITPAEAFMAQIRLAFICGIIVTLPFTIYQVLAFVLPALRKTEKKAIIPLVVSMIFLFALGVVFAYMVVFPFAMRFFLEFAMEDLTPYFTISNYISFVVTFMVAFGIIFETPVVFWFLGHLGIVSSFFLRKNRKFAILVMAVLSAFITPPDIFSQFLMIAPLALLYEAGVVLVRLTERKRSKLSQAEEI